MLSKVNSLVEKGNVSDVLYVANGLEELFKQLPNNRQNIESFYSVYLKLIDRLFGEDVTTIGSDLSLSSGWIRGSPGGWLRLLIDNYQLSNGYKANTLSSINRNSVSSLIGSSPINNNINTNTNIQNSTNTSPVTKLLSHLSPTSAMFDLVAKIQGGFEIKLLLLPSKAQMYISDHPAYPCLQSDNHAKIFHGLLKIPIHSANQRQNISMKQVLMLDAMEYFLICLLRYPTANNFQFLNSKISISNAQQKDVVDMLHNRGIKNWSNGVPYMTIILEYFQHLLTGNFGSSAIGTLAGSEATSSGSETFNERYRELFLRLAVEYWIDCATVIRYEHHKVVHYRNIFTSGMSNMHKAGNSYGMLSSVESSSSSHPESTEVNLLDASSLPWTVPSLQCTYLLVLHYLKSSMLLSRYVEVGTTIAKRKQNSMFDSLVEYPLYTDVSSPPSRDGPRAGRGGYAMVDYVLSCCPHEIQILQLPVFDMLRVMFTRGESSTSNRQILGLAIEVWLLWTQPWNATEIAAGKPLHKMLTNGKQYSKEWRPYVIANLHFYTTLGTLYFRMVARMSLSIDVDEDLKHFSMLERALSTYNNELSNLIKELTGALVDDFRKDISHVSDANPKLGKFPALKNVSIDSAAIELSPEEKAILKAQHQILFPDRSVRGLSDFGVTNFHTSVIQAASRIVSSLCGVELRLQNVDGFFNKLIQRFAKQFQELLGIDALDGHKRILIERIRALIKAFTILIPEAKQGLPDMSVRAVVAHASQVISIDGDERDLYTGKLTKEAKDEIVAGHRKCTHADLRITSMDYIEAPICSFEFRPLAAILILISKRLNKFFNLPIEPQWNNVGWNTIIARHAKGTLRIREVFPKCFRFNLRFLSRFRLIASFAIVLGTIFLKRIGILSYLVLFITMSYIFYEGSFRYYGINFAHVRKLLFGLI